VGRADFNEQHDRWNLLISGGAVNNWALEPEPILELSWPPQARVSRDPIKVSIAPEVLRIEGTVTLGDVTREVTISKDGRLSIVLDGATLTAEPASDYEAWQIEGPGLVVCLPGGGEPAIWFGDGDDRSFIVDPEDPNSVAEANEILKPFFERLRTNR
jgi:Family of unknown function (DUF6188)